MQSLSDDTARRQSSSGPRPDSPFLPVRQRAESASPRRDVSDDVSFDKRSSHPLHRRAMSSGDAGNADHLERMNTILTPCKGESCPFYSLGVTAERNEWFLKHELVHVELPPVRKDFIEPEDVFDSSPTPNPKPIYSSLTSWQTRILELHPGPIDEPLSCKLYTALLIGLEGVGIPELDSVITYEAISYSWGHSMHDVSIQCNGSQLVLERALTDALRFLRYLDKPRYLWCDAICINQEDPDEKAEQVRMMLRIFEKAESVIGWIGNLEPVISGLEKTKNPGIDADISNFFHRDWLRSLNTSYVPQEPVVHQNKCAYGYNLHRQFLEGCLRRPFFRRLWIRQEVFASRRLIVRIGNSAIQFELFRDLVMDGSVAVVDRGFQFQHDYDNDFQTTFNILANDFQHAKTDNEEYRTPERKIPLCYHWLNVLFQSSIFGVTDDKDRVYALLGMLQNDVTRLYVSATVEMRSARYPIDYTLSTERVYENLVKFLINTTGRLDILACFPAKVPASKRTRNTNIASWAVDWRQMSHYYIADPRDRIPRQKTLDQDYKLPGRLRLQGHISRHHLTQIDATISQNEQLEELSSESRFSKLEYLQDLAHLKFVFGSGDVEMPYVIAKAQLPNSDSISLLAVPRAASLDDCIVNLAGAEFSVLLRPHDFNGEELWLFLGPICVIKRQPGDSPRPVSEEYRFRRGLVPRSSEDQPTLFTIV